MNFLKDVCVALFPIMVIVIWIILCVFLAGCEHLGASRDKCYFVTTFVLAISIAIHIISV